MSVNIRAVLGKVPKIAGTLSELRYLVFEGQKGDKGDPGADGHSPFINQNGYWVFWNYQTNTWRVTNLKAEGTPGEDGVSPIVEVTEITRGHRVKITDAEHPSGQTFDVMDGEPGADYVLTPQDKQEIADQAAALVDVPTKTSELQNDSGFVTTQQAAAAAPVQSVNGKTGAVAVREVPDYSNAIDGQVLTKTQYGPRWAANNPSSGAALRLLYDGAFGPDDPDLMLMGNVADAETGNAIATALYYGRIGSAVLVDVTDSNTEVVYDLFAVDYDAQTHVSTVTFARPEADCIRTATLSGSTKSAPTFGTLPLGGSPDAVLYTAQTLTDAQQEQARGNIGAASAEDVAADFAARDRLMQKCQIVTEASENRWDKDSASSGLLGLDGRLYTGGSYDNYCYYNIGNVSEGDVITSYKKQNTAVDSAIMMRVVCYDSGGNAVVSAGTSTATQSFTVPSGVASVAICVTKNTGLTYNYMVLVNAEAAPTDYIPYVEHNVFYRATEDFLPKTSRLNKVNTLLGSDSPTVSAATLASGTALTLTDAPYFIKKNVTVSARMEFETFASVEVGKGQNSYRGKSVIVDGTSITMVSYNDSGTAVSGSVVAHGLTISDYLQVTMFMGDDGKCEVTINTTSGTFDTVFDFSAEWNYSPFVVGAQAMTDVQLGYSCSDIRCPMWVFGDSYLGLWDNRVGGQLKHLGFFNVALVGVAGGRANDGSKATYPDLQRMLALGTPKYIIWTLGMNGGDNVNIAFLPTLMKLCEDKDIELILYKVPSIPTIDHTSLNTFIESTGLRYIDGAAAVGADVSGNWYTDMLSSDGVHPSALGAKALAMRYLTDVPEIMQYGKSGEGGVVESVNGQTGAVTVKTPYYLTVTDNGGTITVDKTPAEIDALSVDGYDVHMRLPLTLGEYTGVGDMRYFSTIGVSAFYGIVWFGGSPLIATARVTDQKVVLYELTETATMNSIPTAVSELTNDSGYQTAQDVQTAINGIRELPTGGSAGDFLRKDSNGNAAWETIPTYQGGSY